MKEYRIAKGWAVFIYIIAPLLIGLFGWVLVFPFLPTLKNSMDPNVYWFLASLSFVMIVLIILGLIDTVKSKFIINNDELSTVGVFLNRRLMLSEVKGYRVTKEFIFIESNNMNRGRLKISRYFGNTHEIVEWLSENYHDLDTVQADREKQEILQNQELGWTVEEREGKLLTARKTAKILNCVGAIIGAWTIFWAEPYEYSIIASIVFPILCLIVLKYYNGLIRLDETNSANYPTLFFGIFISTVGLFLRAFLDYTIFDYSKIWMPSLSIALGYVAILILGNKEFQFNKAKDILIIIILSVFMFGYGYGAVVTLNGVYDQSESEVFKAQVLNKRVSSGKLTTYYLELSPWGPQKNVDEVSASKELFNRLEKNDRVTINFNKGQFDIPWFRVTE